ncbi:MAG TPA: WD40 repeat domain-containing protein [Bryobacteraceae bacterium]|nr:WD40 repeat domain-containing protein [Bryobacteraceae bacterium]
MLCAVDTKTWQQAEMADFEKGTLTRLSLASDGRLALAPVVKEIFDPSVAFLWAVARDSKGNLYAGGGGLGGTKTKLFMVDPRGTSKTLAELEGIAIQAIAIDSRDRVYAATSPDGKVYRIDTQTGKAEVFYDPKQKYIWALEFSRSGDLFVATGDQGEIHRVTPAGAGSVFFKTEETHARSLAIDPNGNLIVGTDPSGLILRITPMGEGFVLYQVPKREITAVAAAPDGTIYAAGVGNKQAPAPPPVQVQMVTPAPSPAVPARPPAAAPPTLAGPAPAITGGSEIYRIQTDGYPRKIWSHPQDLVYALAFDGRGRLLAGTGNHGDIYRLDTEHKYWKLLSLPSTQVTGFCAGAGGKLYAVTGNIGKIFSIGPEQEQTGIFESDIFDAGAFSYWGRVTTSPRENTAVAVETRSGNLNRAQKNWNEFARTNGGRIVSAAARFLQYKLTMSGSGEVTEVDVAYQMKNVAPEIEEVEITPANYKFPAPSSGAVSLTPSLTLPALGHHNASSSSTLGPAADSGSSPAMTYAKGQIGVRWLASDDNGDSMLFKVEIRGATESAWKPLKDKIREHYYSWDSTAFPDGKYFVRITATDAPSNPPDQALTSSAGSEPFLIDNTAPEITGLSGTPAGSKLDIRFHAKDAMNALGKAEYSINGGDWMVVEPTTRLTDSLEHDYRVEVDRAGETTVAVRVSDEYDNQSVAKIVVK